jgi:hypothetical protein
MKVVPAMVGLVLLAVFAFLSVLSLFYGVDSRDGSYDPRSPLYPVGLH